MAIKAGANGSKITGSEVKSPAALIRSEGVEAGGQAQPGGAMVGMPLLVAGSLAFALAVCNFSPVGALVPVLVVVVIGLVVASRWCFHADQAVMAGIFAGFAGFWLTYTGLALGLSHDWFGVDPADTSRAIALFVISWLAVTLMLTVATLAQPLAYLLLIVVFDIALVSLLIGAISGSPGMFTAAGTAMFVISALAAYLCVATIGPGSIRQALPLGRTLVSAGIDHSIVTDGPPKHSIQCGRNETQTATDEVAGTASVSELIPFNGSTGEQTATATIASQAGKS